jgi:cystathionine beta-lyase/cystathionine gamma-synthase
MAIALDETDPVHAPREGVVAQSLVDLADDFDDLHCMTSHRITALTRLRDEIEGGAVPDWVRREVIANVDAHLGADLAASSELTSLIDAADEDGSLTELTRARRRHAETFRTRQGLASGLFVAADWHSPSIAHSVFSNAGRRDGQVRACYDDYKRDRHPDQAGWEQAWLVEMVDNPAGHRLGALQTASGMAAITTILAHIETQATDGPVLCGEGIYHECREQLARSELRDRIVTVSETNTAAWKDALDLDPGAIFLDTMCNSAGLSVPDTPWLIQAVHDRARSVIIVLDNTARSVSFQPWRILPVDSAVRMVVFESLTKYPQLGADRAAGGVIVSGSSEVAQLDAMREHLGTNIADAVVYQHPWPDRRLLERRLGRLGRNAALIAHTVAGRLEESESPLRVVYPGMTTPARLWETGFRGGYLTIESHEPDVDMYRRLLRLILDVASLRDVPICEGTSFGFDTTRVYLISAEPHGIPFLRISAGAEHFLGAHAVADVLAEALGIPQ